MTFDQQLTQAFDTLTERLRGEVDQEVERRVAEIAAAAPPPPPPAPPVEPEPVPAVAPPVFDAASAARQHDAVRAIDAARSLTEVLDALVHAARAEASDADVWLSRGGQLHQWRAPGSHDAVREAPTGSLVVPIAIAGADVAVLYADFPGQGAASAEPTTNLEQRATNVELLTRYAARTLEALTAFKVARALTQPAGPDAGGGSPADIGGPSAEEDTSALRYARLLVSEIKLYHESAVIDGRRDRDLATRLGGEIARARAMYEQRVAPHVRERADYFRDELVRTLCNGDASLLERKT